MPSTSVHRAIDVTRRYPAHSAAAATLADAGARAVINGRGRTSVESTIADPTAESADRDLVAVPGDVTDGEGTADVLVATGDVDILVDNLGILGSAPVLEISDEEWRRYLDVNVLAAVRQIRATLPGMKERVWGRVLNIASDSAVFIPTR